MQKVVDYMNGLGVVWTPAVGNGRYTNIGAVNWLSVTTRPTKFYYFNWNGYPPGTDFFSPIELSNIKKDWYK
jgi:hypothetical protein